MGKQATGKSGNLQAAAQAYSAAPGYDTVTFAENVAAIHRRRAEIGGGFGGNEEPH